MRWNVLGDGLYLPTRLSVLTTNTGQGHQQFHRNPVLSPRHSSKTNFTMVTVTPQGCNVYKANTAQKSDSNLILKHALNLRNTHGLLISDWCKISKCLFVLTVLPVTRFSQACEASDHQLKYTLAVLYLSAKLINFLVNYLVSVFLGVESGSCLI